ncbi:hypothetical protein WDU94_003659 [Cyamophila willieti]
MTGVSNCPICTLSIIGRQNRLKCLLCKTIVHSKCAGVKSPEEFQLIVDTYTCVTCKNGSSPLGVTRSQSSGKGPSGTDVPESKLDTLIAEFKGLKKAVSALTIENGALKNEIKSLSAKLSQLCPSAPPKPTYAQSLKQPVQRTNSNSSSVTMTQGTRYNRSVSQSSSNQQAAGTQSLFNPVQSLYFSDSESDAQTAPQASKDGFQEVRRKPRQKNKANAPPSSGQMSSQRPSRPAPFIGERVSTSIMAVAPQKKVRTKGLFTTRFNPSVTIKEIEDYVRSSVPLLTTIKFTRLTTKFDTYASYHVEVSDKDFQFVNNPLIWPDGILVKEFRGPLKSEICYSNNPPLPPGTEQGVVWQTFDVSNVNSYNYKMRASYLVEFISYLNLSQIMRGSPLCPEHHMKDLLFANIHEYNIQDNVSKLVKMDYEHPPLLVSFHFLAKPASPPDHTSFNFAKGNYHGLYYFFQNYDWSMVSDEPNVHVATSRLTNIIQEGINAFIPQNFVKPSKQKYPHWFSQETINLLKHKERVHRKFKRSHSNSIYREFSNLRSQCKKSISRDQYKKFKKIQHSFLSAQSSFWQHVGKVTKPKHGIDVLLHDGHPLNDDVEIASCFGSYFASVYKDPRLLPPAASVRLDVPDHSDFLPLPTVTPVDVLSSIKTLKPSLSVGVDGIPAFILKGCGHVLAPVLSSIFNKSLLVGIFPSTWKTAVVVPIFKKGSRFDVANYRPIALLSVLSKIFEKLVFKNLYAYIDKYLSPLQHGFRQKMSTSTNILDFLNYVSKFIDRQNQVDVVYFDVAKAFDVVHHDLLLLKLEKYGLSTNYVKWFRSYLVDRSFKVKIGNTLSGEYPILSGIPQGSNLGPLLFLIFINDVLSVISCQALLFADDLKIFHGYDHASPESDVLQSNISNVVKWYDRNYLAINVSKTRAITFTRKYQYTSYPYEVNGAPILRVFEIVDLGFLLDHKLLFNKYVADTVNKCFSRFGMLLKLCGRFDLPTILITLFNMFIRSKIDYGLLIFCSVHKTNCDQLERVQKFLVGAVFLLP